MDKYPILLTGDFNCKGKNENDVIYFLEKNGFCNSINDIKNCVNHWTFPTIGYMKEIFGKCKKRGKHFNNKDIKEQKFCDENCDKENGVVIDYCFKINNGKINFTKYIVLTDYEACGGISSDHYPIYLEGVFL